MFAMLVWALLQERGCGRRAKPFFPGLSVLLEIITKQRKRTVGGLYDLWIALVFTSVKMNSLPCTSYFSLQNKKK